MKSVIFAAGILAWSVVIFASVSAPAPAQTTGTSLEQQIEGATDPGMEGAANTADPDMPRDPGKGPVTNLPLPRYVTLKGSEGNARRGPGLTHRIDWVFTREGMPLKLTAEYEHWRRVEDVDGAGGWIHYTLLSGVRSILVTKDMAQAYSNPDEKSDVVYQSELGVIGKLLECNPDWCRVSVEGEKGWMKKTSLWGVDQTEIYP